MTLNVINEMYKRLESSAQNFRSLGGLEVSNSLTSVGTQGVREKGGKEKKKKSTLGDFQSCFATKNHARVSLPLAY